MSREMKYDPRIGWVPVEDEIERNCSTCKRCGLSYCDQCDENLSEWTGEEEEDVKEEKTVPKACLVKIFGKDFVAVTNGDGAITCYSIDSFGKRWRICEAGSDTDD